MLAQVHSDCADLGFNVALLVALYYGLCPPPITAHISDTALCKNQKAAIVPIL
jgi:hypothetical protein